MKSRDVTGGKNGSLYNEEIKHLFFDSLSSNQDTVKYYTRVLLIASALERMLNKDLNQFTFEEIEKVLYSFKSNNRNTIVSYGRVISGYLKWCVQKGLATSNLLEQLKPDDFMKYVVNQEVYLAEGQLRRIEDQCDNYQDAVIFRLLFEGVGGKEMSEIRNLKIDDVDIHNHTVQLINSLVTDDKGLPVRFKERTLKVDERTIELIMGARIQKSYKTRDGSIEDLVDNTYVVRSVALNSNSNFKNSPLEIQNIYKRIDSVMRKMSIDNIKPKLIQRSGMMRYANQIIGDAKELTLNDLKIVADRFNLTSYHNLKGFLTMDNIRKIYPK
ncbi:site-specific integrase [Thermoactinomyces sp. DSM 45892]|uniref:phage lytic cycle repressor MrpR family protein n=1 Tax=Thermoactinomyces sp. DSM 45892 TaxID=1882753 RepID=UPI00089AFACB|nr:site-specific integrase [Thermoactinomyces sp. DSM 45892]SDX94111.1 hypothetical protein SAMN05444416_10162 [Thermoactinomyces sp. DSM 45892]